MARKPAKPKKTKAAQKPKPRAKASASAPAPPPPPPSRSAGGGFWRWIRRGIAAVLWLSIAGAGGVLWYAWDLPDPDDLTRIGSRRPAITILAADGTQIMKTGDIFGDPIRLDRVPDYLPNAFLATEDRRFYDHFGVDPLGIARAMIRNITSGGVVQGGSTITQQLAKNLFLTRARTIRRKVQEALLAIWLEQKFSKAEILELYLNRVYLGAGANGVDAAAQRYFGKPAAKISPWQAAVLAGLPKAPSALNPFRFPEKAATRARVVLGAMVDAGYLTQQGASDMAQQSVTTVADRSIGRDSRWFSDWVFERAEDLMGKLDRDIVVHTTLEPALQRAARNAAAKTSAEARAKGAGELAFVAVRGDGAVAAMLGGHDASASAFNRVTQARRQPGSTFKLFVYLAGLEAGLRPNSKIDDQSITVEGWTPRNASRGHRGMVTFREGAARSINTVAVAIGERVGRQTVVRMARRLGITSTINPDPALALGVYEVAPLEMTAAYASLAAGGYAVTPYAIRRIEGRDGLLLYQRDTTADLRVIGPEVTAAADDLLRAVVDWGTGKRAKPDSGHAAGKTGTSQDYRDAWFIGYRGGGETSLTAGVWMGNDDASPTDGVYGGLYPAILWRRFMDVAAPGG